MAKKIFTTDDEINEFLRKANAELGSFTSSIRTTKFQHDKDDEIVLRLKFDTPKDNRRAKLIFSPKAWNKMYMLVYAFSSEVQWHGVVERKDETTFLVKDILVFPHEATGATVVSDQNKYEEWLDTLDDATFNALRFHGHSHVNMCVSPSGVDMTYRKNMLNNFELPNETTDLFYIFIITNKKEEISGEIYDLQNNALYGTDEIEFGVQEDDGECLKDFLKKAKEIVTEPYRGSYTGYGTYSGGVYSGTGGTTPTTQAAANPAPPTSAAASKFQPVVSAKHKAKKEKPHQKATRTPLYGVGIGSCMGSGNDYDGYDDDDGYYHNLYGARK